MTAMIFCTALKTIFFSFETKDYNELLQKTPLTYKADVSNR